MTRVSVIIPSWNRKEDLEECLDSVLKQNFKDYEIIIVDNGSSDGTIQLIEEKYPNIILIKNNKNVGASQARNQAIKISKGEYLWFLDSDAIVLKKDCLKNMIKILEGNPIIGQLGGEVIKLNNEFKIRISNSCRNQDGIFKFVNKCKLLETDYVATSNCIVKKDLIYNVGGFDPNYIYGYEDNSVGYKILKLGYKNMIDDRVLVHHKRAIIGRVGNFYMWHRNRIRFLIIKENLLFLIFLPIIDIYTTIKILPKRIQVIKNTNLNDIVSLRQTKKKEKGLIYKILTLGFNYGVNWILGYCWNIIHLPQTLYIRIKKPNFIEK